MTLPNPDSVPQDVLEAAAWPELNYSTAPGLLILHPSTPAIAPSDHRQLAS